MAWVVKLWDRDVASPTIPIPFNPSTVKMFQKSAANIENSIYRDGFSLRYTGKIGHAAHMLPGDLVDAVVEWMMDDAISHKEGAQREGKLYHIMLDLMKKTSDFRKDFRAQYEKSQ